MGKAMQEIEVYVAESGNICIKREIPMEDDYIIDVHPDQVPILIQWLREAMRESKQMKVAE